MADSREMSPVSSQLSSHGSSEFADAVKMEDPEENADSLHPHDTHPMPPSKRRRTGVFSHQSTPVPLVDMPEEDLGDISEDTSGSIPNSPTEDKLRMPDEDPMAHEQVTACKWESCSIGDVGNMDNLVHHLHDDHIGTKQTSHACEWYGCQRKGQAHASAYALKAHMRSHTKEKPFYCALPECDRSFTRSDALAKHMRTVHETEALRPSDPVPRNYSSAHFKPQRLKLIVNSKPPAGNSDRDAEIDDDATIYTNTDNEADNLPLPPYEYPADIQFTNEELAMPPDKLFSLLRRQVHWAQEEGSELRDDIKALEDRRKEEWMEKELVLVNVMEAEIAFACEKGEPEDNVHRLMKDLPETPLPMSEVEKPWYRDEKAV